LSGTNASRENEQQHRKAEPTRRWRARDFFQFPKVPENIHPFLRIP
jgi:hypothetical protein